MLTAPHQRGTLTVTASGLDTPLTSSTQTPSPSIAPVALTVAGATGSFAEIPTGSPALVNLALHPIGNGHFGPLQSTTHGRFVRTAFVN